MNMFNIFINLIEAVCISVIIAPCLNKNKIYILLQTCIIALTTTFYNYENMTFVLVCAIVVSAMVTAFLFFRKIKGEIISQILLAMLINSFSNLCTFLFLSCLKSMPINELFNSSLIVIEASLISKFLNIVIAIQLYKRNFKFNVGKLYYLITAVLIISTFIVHSLSDAIAYDSINLKTIQLICFLFIIFVILLILIIYFINKDFENNLKVQRFETQERMVKNNLILIESISAKLSDMEHKMNYVLLSLKYLIIKRSENEALNLIDKNLWNLSKMTYYVNTKNPYFDNLFAGVLKKISQKNISPIIICEVEKGRLDKNIYLTSVFIEAIDKISEFLKESQKLKIEIHSHVNYICLSVFLLGDNLDEISKIEIDTKNFKENNINFTCNSIEQNMLELKFVVMEATE